MLLLFIGLIVFVPSASLAPTSLVNDTVTASVAAWNVGANGTLDLASQGWETFVWSVSNEDRLYPKTFPGTYALAVPMYALVRGLESVPNDLEEPEPIPVWPASLTAAIVAAGVLVLGVELLREVVDRGVALIGGLLVAFATPFWSVAADALWTHGPVILWLTAGTLMLARNRLWAAGAFYGLAILTRPTAAVVPLVVGVGAAIGNRGWRPIVQVGLPAAAGLAALSLYSQIFFDTWLPITGYPTERVGAVLGTGESLFGVFTLREQLWGLLFDTYRGLLVFTPLLLPLGLASVRAWTSAPLWVRTTALAGLLYGAMQVRGNPFPGGYGFWGYRYPLEPLFLALPLLALAYQTVLRPSRWGRRITLLTAGASLALIVPGALFYAVKPEPWRPGYGTPEIAGLVRPEHLELVADLETTGLSARRP